VKILFVPGDGIGPEITAATLNVVEALQRKFGLDIEIEHADCGLASVKRYGTTLRDEDMERARRADGVVLGPMSIREYPPRDAGGVHVPAAFRRELDLYANIRPSYVRPGLPATVRSMDLVFVRENLEDFYVDRNMHLGIGEFMPTPDVVLAVGKITREGSRRVARAAFELAQRRKRRKVTIVHKDPVLKLYNGMFVEEARNAAKSFPNVEVEDLLVDAVAALLIRTPDRFDVVLTTNVFGDILSDEASELAGSLGLAASLNRGDVNAVANAGHGSAPDIAGKDIANPASLMISTAMLLEHLGATRNQLAWSEAGSAFIKAVDRNLASADTRTRDLGGQLGTRAFGLAVAQTVSSS
jgi:isocitrate/isopropylmalate dehydrogenase